MDKKKLERIRNRAAIEYGSEDAASLASDIRAFEPRKSFKELAEQPIFTANETK